MIRYMGIGAVALAAAFAGQAGPGGNYPSSYAAAPDASAALAVMHHHRRRHAYR
jgi:hypothetical protein